MEYKNLIGGAITDKISIYNCELDVDYYNKAIQRIKNHVSQLKLF